MTIKCDDRIIVLKNVYIKNVSMKMCTEIKSGDRILRDSDKKYAMGETMDEKMFIMGKVVEVKIYMYISEIL